MRYVIHQHSESASFPAGDPFLLTGSADGEVVVHLGNHLGVFQADAHKAAILVELGTECLGVHTGEAAGEEGSNVLGFARYRNGSEAPSPLIELVRQPGSKPEAIAAAKAILESARFTVVVCSDQTGRIVDRLVRPKYNDALRFLDEGLATAKDMDLTCRLGLGYRDGPIERVERGGLANHYDVTAALFEVYGTPAYAPARRAVVARQRRDRT
jgi:3-hydroxybutyryl-CoA dehydrogenase